MEVIYVNCVQIVTAFGGFNVTTVVAIDVSLIDTNCQCQNTQCGFEIAQGFYF